MNNAVGDDDLVIGLVERVLEESPTEEREQFAREACGGDPVLFDKVWRYVQWDSRMKGFLLDPLHRLVSDEILLVPGQVLENRFRIVRKVAAGGMGVVFEAFDEKLERRIAIKCAKTGFGARLPPEVRLASEINHRNVCKIWEIHTASGLHGDFDFLTMEFIEGQTLAERLRAGPIPKKEIRSIALQLCAGLAEAHRQQVIHGDLKSGNVLLSQEPGGTRAAITDFGLARDNVSTSNELGGTLDYMAPELLARARPSFASDVYALGVILQELVASQPGHPWGRIIARCLEAEPGRRANLSQVAAAFAPPAVLRWSLIAAAVVLSAFAVAIGYRTGSAPRAAVRLAFLPFATTDADGKSLSDGLFQDTAERLRRVDDSRTKLTVIPIGVGLQNKADALGKTLAVLGATHMLTGTLHKSNGRVSIHAVLTDARSQLQLKEWNGEYEPGELRNMPVALAGIVTGTLRLPPLPSAATVSAAAYPDFAAGVGLLEQNSLDLALPFLERAVAADPESPLTYARLAEAQARKYRVDYSAEWLDRATATLQKAEQRNSDLPLIWVVSARINEYKGLYEAAESDLKRALELDGRDGDAWRRLGRVYKQINLFPASIVAFQRAIEVQPGYFLNYQDLCGVYREQGEYKAAIEQCRKGVELAPDLSDAHWGLSVALFCQGEYAESESESNLALRLDPRSTHALFSRAFALTSQGRAKESIPLYLRAINIGPQSALLYCDLGTAYRLAGSPALARKAYSTALSLAQKELEQNQRDAIRKAQLAYMCARLGEKNRAKFEAKLAKQPVPSSVEVAWWLLLTWEALGEQEEALAILQQLPDDTLHRLNREADLADFRRSSRFQQVMASHHIQ